MRSLVLAVALVALLAAPVSAQDDAIPVATSIHAEGAVPFEAIVSRALDHPRARRARAEAEAARARIDRARVLPSPHLRGGVATLDVSGARAPTLTTLELTVPIPYSGSIASRIEASSALEEAGAALTELTELSLRAEAARAYAEALEAALVVQTRRSLLARAETIVTLVERRVALGEGSLLDAAAARLERAHASAELGSAEAALLAAELALAELATLDPGEPPAVAGSLRFPDPPADLPARIEDAIARRPDVRAIRLAILAAEREREARQRERAPDVSVYVGWQHSFDSLGSLFNQPEYDAVLFGLDVELPVRLAWDGELRESDAVLSAHAAELEALELSARHEMFAAARALEGARARARILEAALVDAQLAARLVTRTVEIGEASVLSVIAAERLLGEAIEGYQHALGAAAAAHLELLRALGEPIDHWPGRLD